MWAPPKDPAMLDYKNAIIALIGRSPNLGKHSHFWRWDHCKITSLQDYTVL